MKKVKQRVLSICVAVLLVGTLAGCGSKASVVNAAKEMSWTAVQWEEASADEKKVCALAYTEYIADVTGIANAKEQLENLSDDELNAVVMTLDSLFKSSGEQSLKEATDAMVGETENAAE